MKQSFWGMLSLFLLIALLVSLFSSCGNGERTGEPDNNNYLGENVDLGLSENETLMDIIEVDGELRATVGVTSDEMVAKYGTEYGTPYKTEYRYYDMEFVEDTAKREPTASFHQIAQHYDPSLNLTIGGEPYLYTDENGVETSYGVRYKLYKDGEPIGDVLNPVGPSNYGRYTNYGVSANVVMAEDTPYVWLNYKDYYFELFVKDRFVKSTEIPVEVSHAIYGLMEIDGVPYALVHAEQYDDFSKEYTYFQDPLWKETRLIPLTAETAELSLEGTELDGVPTGGAFGDGTHSYYMCGSELWRTDGKESQRISELIFCGVNGMSDVRSVRSLSDGRILMVVNGELIELTASETSVPAERNVYVLGVMDGGYFDDISLLAAKFNSQGGEYQFVAKEYKDITRLNLALLSGEVDVIVTADQFALKNYVKQDLLAPLEEVVPEFFEEGVLIENIVDVTREDGTCYYLPREFAIWGRVMEYRLLEKGEPFETLDAYYDFIRENDPRFLRSIQKRQLFTHMTSALDEWIDWENNNCHFDDGSFEATLEFCNEAAPSYETTENSYPTPGSLTPTYSGLLYLDNLIYDPYFTRIESAKEYVAGLENGDPEVLPETNEGGWAWVAHPLPSAVYDGFAIDAERYFAVVDKEESREAAGAFLRWHFLEDVVGEIAPDDPGLDYNDYNIKQVDRFSINQAECERYVGRNLAWDGSNKEVRLALEQRKYEDTWNIIKQADHLQHFDNAIFRVMNEEAYRYFDGEITAKQAAEYVQNRISIYLAEQS
ncbi:MAG: hypothetical protein E7428_02205 [Ruminococcaceae bacterium]|nr:hypothetical protein [Oscillospiraceae bacterium]